MSANLNADEAAAYLGGAPITATTVKALARSRKIGHVKVGRATVFPIAALDEYIAGHTVAVESNAWGLTDASARSIRNGRARRSA